jgi:hypothetical protein
LFGLARANVTRSLSDFASSFGFTTTSIDMSATFDTGTNAVSGSNGSFE